MSLLRKKSSLRADLSQVIKKKTVHEMVGKLRGRYLFRAAVRLVFEYMSWITAEPTVEEAVDDVTRNVKKAQQKTGPEKRGLTLQDRSILLTKPGQRTRENRNHISQILKNFQAFKRYSEEIKESITAVCRYQYLGPGRVIVRQGHKAFALYYILNGEVNLSRIVMNNITGDATEINVGTMSPGDMFGEIALLYSIPRTATVVSKTPVDLLYITLEDFDKILRPTLLEEWDELRDALINFNYFKGWNENTIRECCILSRIKHFEPNEVLLGDGKGMVNSVYFVLEGECRLIEHMLVHEQIKRREHKYRLYKPVDLNLIDKTNSNEGTDSVSQQEESSLMKINQSDIGSLSDIDYTQVLLSMRPTGNIDVDRMSIVTMTLQDVVNQWHEITDVAEMLMREPSSISLQQYPKNVRTVFMKICQFHRGACFGLGEKMMNRRIVSITRMKCLLVPRYWLLEHNRANIWERVKLFLDSKYPSTEKLFEKFVRNRRWLRYKKDLIEDIVKNGRKIQNNTSIHDVPYSIRINEEIMFPNL
ncbi:cyclic nucleotide-binding domain-containing protein 2-like [Cephus cinctus]|uniref:Cyclic nucleotide-binding domain-containing protein 2-like n=1 Tax=Cephus cinctus TaxID=211228 RepID=A0AAJ7RRX1_CEPCN|nr:cyclic nucleotide-binding domain-containing protein 2-like [Cephus cinctus]